MYAYRERTGKTAELRENSLIWRTQNSTFSPKFQDLNRSN